MSKKSLHNLIRDIIINFFMISTLFLSLKSEQKQIVQLPITLSVSIEHKLSKSKNIRESIKRQNHSIMHTYLNTQ